MPSPGCGCRGVERGGVGGCSEAPLCQKTKLGNTHTKSPEGMLQNVPLQNQIEHIQHAAHIIIIIIIIITIRRFCLQLNLWLVTFGDLSFRSELIHPPKGGCSYCVY
jgi:hypothetical protein